MSGNVFDRLKQKFGDQITGNATRGPWSVLAFLPAYLLVGIFSFLGWPILALWRASKSRPSP
mgnify:CR=1 FL=1